MNFNLPKNARTRPTPSGRGLFFLLSKEDLWRHEAAAGLKQPVVVCDMAVMVSPGHAPGDHDGVRDGYAPPQRVFKRVYSSLEDWLAAGNPAPKEV